ncbi:PhnE/PtxC family ABC transporter permease [Tenggerimyces flavus]|uniref:PhnE/PtxC family ABC transporter permease n=1 Tax=Tenggerimyces flavus TaxID=1708749 RepID=A0ABV7YP20_9ACTN|nr:ABC transporter permease subunit [Tenggerimyces flavus]MBM7789393.1 phosphonate transport system permease protein [Tenggerimyces flavus]
MTTLDLPVPARNATTTTRRVLAWIFPLSFAILGLAALSLVGPSPASLVEGAQAGMALLVRAWPPTLADPMLTASHALQTIWMALAGTALGAILGALLGVLAAAATMPYRPIRSAAMAVIVACRAIPDVVFAVFFVAAIGIGPLPGVLALGLHSIGMLGKLFSEAIDRTDDGVRDAFASTGGGPVQRLVAGVLPQVVPAFTATVLYRLDINFRQSVLLGAVGAGGLGLDLKTAFGFTDYREALGIAVVTVSLVLVVEGVAVLLRSLLVRAPSQRGRLPIRGTTVPWTRPRTVTHVAGWLGLLLVLLAAWQVGAGPAELWQTVVGTLDALGRFWPPNFAPIQPILLAGLVQTCAIALGATALGVLFGLPLGLLAAHGVAPPRVVAVARTVLVTLRSIPDLLLILVFVAAFGLALGAVAATCALAVFTTAFVGKLVADAAEEIPYGTREALASAGANRTQLLTTWLLGHLTPTLTGTILYGLDVNLRAFVVLGIVGAGDLGYALSQHIRALNYDVVTAIVLPVFAIVLVVEVISTLLRRALR